MPRKYSCGLSVHEYSERKLNSKSLNTNAEAKISAAITFSRDVHVSEGCRPL